MSGDFIQKNPAQLCKELIANSVAEANSFEFVVLDGSGEGKSERIRGILAEIVSLASGNSVFLIGRYHHNAPSDLQSIRSKFPGRNIDPQQTPAHPSWNNTVQKKTAGRSLQSPLQSAQVMPAIAAGFSPRQPVPVYIPDPENRNTKYDDFNNS